MKIVADIKMAYDTEIDGMMFERLTYDPETKSATSEIFVGIGNPKKVRPARRGFGLKNIDCYRFLECLGHDNQAGRLLNVEIVETMKPCHRTVHKLDGSGEVEDIVVDSHSFSWTGRVPCTGRYACMYCGKTKEELAS